MKTTLYLLELNLSEKLGVFESPEAARQHVAELTNNEVKWRGPDQAGCEHGRIFQHEDNYWISRVSLLG